jgi:hypothetical protein
VLYNRTLVTQACRCVFVLPGDDALLSDAWRAITSTVGSTAPLLGGLLEPSGQPGGGRAVVDPRPFCCNWLTGERGCSRASPVGGGAGGSSGVGTCPFKPGAGEVCVAATTYAQVVVGVAAPLALSHVLLQRTRQRLLAERLRDRDGERRDALRQQRRREQPALGPSSGGGGVACGGGELDALHVSPIAVLFAAAAVSNLAYCAVAWTWSV